MIAYHPFQPYSFNRLNCFQMDNIKPHSRYTKGQSVSSSQKSDNCLNSNSVEAFSKRKISTLTFLTVFKLEHVENIKELKTACLTLTSDIRAQLLLCSIDTTQEVLLRSRGRDNNKHAFESNIYVKQENLLWQFTICYLLSSCRI